MAVFCQLPMAGYPFIINAVERIDIDRLIGMNLRRLRERIGLSQAELAEKIGTTPQRLSAYETGRDGMGKDYMERICKALDVEPWEFYINERSPLISSEREQHVLYLYRKAEAMHVAEDIAQYAEFRILGAAAPGNQGSEAGSERVEEKRKIARELYAELLRQGRQGPIDEMARVASLAKQGRKDGKPAKKKRAG